MKKITYEQAKFMVKQSNIIFTEDHILTYKKAYNEVVEKHNKKCKRKKKPDVTITGETSSMGPFKITDHYGNIIYSYPNNQNPIDDIKKDDTLLHLANKLFTEILNDLTRVCEKLQEGIKKC